jgi:methyl-accepting chemotaxis protein
MKYLNSVSARVLVGYIAALSITIISAILVGILYVDAKQRTHTFINQTLPQITAIESVLSLTATLELSAYSLYGMTLENEDLSTVLDRYHAEITSPLRTLDPQVTAVLKTELEQLLASVTQLQQVMSVSSVNWDVARDILATLSTQTLEIRQRLAKEKAAITQLAEASSSKIIDNLNTLQRINWIMVSLLAVVLLFAYLYARRNIVHPVSQLATGLGKISDHLDLSARIPARHDDEIGDATRKVNRLLETFSQALGHVNQTASNVQDSSKALEQVTVDSERAIQMLGNNIDQLQEQMLTLEEQIASSVDRSNSAADKASKGAEEVESGAQEVKKTAESIAGLVNEIESTGDMLGKLQASGEQVSSVVKTVAEIAEQTNLLALNAAIEAARAGESGRGFAVVADEIRTLALRTHQSTEEIDAMIKTISSAIMTTVDTMSVNRTKAQESMTQASATVNVLSSLRKTILSLSQTSSEVAGSAQSVQQQMMTSREQLAQFKLHGENVTRGSKETHQQAIQLTDNAKILGKVIGQFHI